MFSIDRVFELIERNSPKISLIFFELSQIRTFRCIPSLKIMMLTILSPLGYSGVYLNRSGPVLRPRQHGSSLKGKNFLSKCDISVV